jgi:hypothetical protein
LIAEGLIPHAQSETAAAMWATQSDAAAALQTAFIAAAVALLVAVITQVSLFRRDRRERLYQSRRTALLDVQDAALALRQALAEYGPLVRITPGERTDEVLDAERQFDRTSGILEVRLSRMDNPEVAELVANWQRIAQVSSISVKDEVSRSDEHHAWATLNAAIGNALGEA